MYRKSYFKCLREDVSGVIPTPACLLHILHSFQTEPWFLYLGEEEITACAWKLNPANNPLRLTEFILNSHIEL